MPRPPPPDDFSGTLVDLTEGTIDDFVGNHTLVLIDFWAPWCGPCRMIEPQLKQLARQHRRKLFIGRVNIDHEKALAQRFRVSAVPTMHFFVSGKHKGTFTGAVPRSEMDRSLAKFLAAATEERPPTGPVPVAVVPQPQVVWMYVPPPAPTELELAPATSPPPVVEPAEEEKEPKPKRERTPPPTPEKKDGYEDEEAD